MLVLGLADQGRRGALSAHTELSFHSAELENRQRSKCIIRNCGDATKHKNLGGNLQRSLKGGDIEADPERGKVRSWRQTESPGREDILTKGPGAGNRSEQRPACGVWCLERRTMEGEVGVSIRSLVLILRMKGNHGKCSRGE